MKFYSTEARLKAERSSELGWQKKKCTKKKVHKKKMVPRLDSGTTNFVPGQTIHFLVEFFTFLYLFQPPKTFSYFFHFHNLSKRHSEKTIFAKKFSEKKKKLKELIHFFSICFFSNFFFSNFFSIFFFLCPKPTRQTFSFYFIVIHLLPTKKKIENALRSTSTF